LTEEASATISDDESITSSGSPVYSARDMARDIERGSIGRKKKGKETFKGNGKTTKKPTSTTSTSSESSDKLDVVKTCRCICPLQHKLFLKELENAELHGKKMRLEIKKLERELN
jgi:hypothetical protein